MSECVCVCVCHAHEQPNSSVCVCVCVCVCLLCVCTYVTHICKQTPKCLKRVNEHSRVLKGVGSECVCVSVV